MRAQCLNRPPCAQDAATSVCAFYEIVAQSKEAAIAAGADPHGAQQFFVQFITRYLHADGTSRARVTTFTRRWGPLGEGFPGVRGAASMRRC